jgi:hypothetical protein
MRRISTMLAIVAVAVTLGAFGGPLGGSAPTLVTEQQGPIFCCPQ